MKKEKQVHILSSAIEMLYKVNSIDSLEFLNLFNDFKNILISIRYPSNFYIKVYDLILRLRREGKNQIKIKVHITGIKEIDFDI